MALCSRRRMYFGGRGREEEGKHQGSAVGGGGEEGLGALVA